MEDYTLVAGAIGALGSILGTLGGVVLGYKLNNKKASIGVYVDNKINVYYLREHFCMYLPISITNEGDRSSTITTFEAEVISPTAQKWRLHWNNFAEDNSHTGEGWVDGKAANPILVHGNSGNQHYIKLIGLGKTSEGYSDVALNTGEYLLNFSAYDRNRQVCNTQSYVFHVETEAAEHLAARRKDHSNLQSWWFPLFNRE